jgi:hypothetical protein
MEDAAGQENQPTALQRRTRTDALLTLRLAVVGHGRHRHVGAHPRAGDGAVRGGLGA